MIDLHSHVLPGLDDGARDLATALEMARIAVADGITTMVCTPHITPGVYDNNGHTIQAAVAVFTDILQEKGIALRVLPGADIHATPDLVAKLRNGLASPINGGRHFLFEPPHDVLPPRLDTFLFGVMAAGYMPILTHPERLSWIEHHYAKIVQLASAGVLIQLTAGAITGRFGRRAAYWCERMIDEGLVHVVASDAHDPVDRPPILSKARDFVAARWGEETALAFVLGTPLHIVDGAEPPEAPVVNAAHAVVERSPWFERWGPVGRNDVAER